MPKYNIYKINKIKESALIEKLISVDLVQVGQKKVEDFTLTFYLSEAPEDIGIWWTDVYGDYIDSIDKPKNKVYYAVFLVSNSNICYAISMGKSHFYLKDFCDMNFGINLAERIADNNSLKLKNTKLFGGKKNKTIVSYQENSQFEFDSGESVHYIKAKTIDGNKWGKTASFGNSVQFHLEITPDALPMFIQSIEYELQTKSLNTIPRATSISDKNKSKELDKKLIQEILHANAELQPAEATISGVDFIFLDAAQYSFVFEHKTYPIGEELNLTSLQNFIEQQKINLSNNIDKIRIKVSNEHNKGYTKPLKYFLDYVDDEKHFLLDGTWHIFNQNYIDFLQRTLDDGITLEMPDINFSNSEFQKWHSALSEEDKKSPCYPECYFNTVMQEKHSYINLDRQIETLRKFKIEKLDLYKDKIAYFVKIGTPQKLGYAIDQATATMKILQNKESKINIGGQDINPNAICLWFILDRKIKVSKISDIKSLIFLMKLSEWQKQCRNAGYTPIIRLGYKVE